ncbi:MAG: hypothetical protein IJB83_01880 [Bacilli bacterium]|nr:hypothetical protein [Bacilli bacterium]
MKINKKIVLPIILVLIAGVFVITLAYFGAEVIENGNNPTDVTTGNLDVSLSDSAVSVSSLKPIYAQYIDSMAFKKEFTITNAEDSLDSSNDIYLNISSISNELKNQYFKYKVVVDKSEKSGDFSSAVNGERLLIYNDLAIKSNTSKTITLYIWIEYAEGIDQLDMLGTELSANLVIESTDKKMLWYSMCTSQSNNLNCKIITVESPSSDENIDFSQMSSNTNGKGLYYTSNLSLTEDYDGDGEGERVYYYRGAVENNNVRFGGYCWRIVRTNEDGSVRLRYNGVYENGTCPTTGTEVRINNEDYEFYESSDNEKYNEYIWKDGTGESLAKSIIDAWYTTSGLESYADKIANVPYCADKSNPTKSDTSLIFYGAANRLMDITTLSAKSDAQPTYKCEMAEDKHTVSGDTWGGNGKLSKPLGLLTADEIAFAGGRRYNSDGSSSNSTYYLYTSGKYWTTSPFYWPGYSAGVFCVDFTGALVNDFVNTSHGLLPVISLKAETMVSAEGDGSYTNPFVVD